MGKSIKACTSIIPPKKGTLKKITKNIKKHDPNNLARKKPDVIESYLRTLSSNFGTTASSSNTTSKRKYDEQDISEDDISEEEIQIVKKPKLSQQVCTSKPDDNIQTSNSIVDIKFERILTHLDSKDEHKDLFCLDESKCSNEHTYYVDWLHELCNEISLEGLDGITIEALWSRMKSNSKHPLLLEGKEEMLWNLVKYIDQIEFYILENARPKLAIYDKNSYVCPDSGIVLEAMVDYGEPYPYAMLNRDGVRGSCLSYHSRMENTEIIKKIGLKEALDIYGNRLVAVASQKMRENAIISEIADPKVELGDNEYGLLERVGRARGFGELTQGKVSVLGILKDSKTIFHIRKTLERKKLLTNQSFMLRNEETGQNKTGKLLHIPRYYRLQKNKRLLLIEEIVELLRQRPGYSLEFGEFRKYFPRSTGAHKVIKSPEFTKYIKTDIFRPYRYLYPNATVSEWKYKNKNKEKTLRLFQLVDPTINVAASWNNPDNEETLEDELGEEQTGGIKYFSSEFLKEVFSAIFKEGKEGVTLQELVKKVNLDYYTVRTAIRKLLAKNVIDTFRTEHGKQRHIYYFARCFHSGKKPMPESRISKIPKSMLQKILRNKKKPKSKEIKIDSNIIMNSEKVKTYSSQNFPLLCPAFIAVKEIVDAAMDEEPSIDWKNWKFHPKTYGFCDIRIMPKFCKIIFESREKVWNFLEPLNIITCRNNGDGSMKQLLLKSLLTGKKLDAQNMLPGNDIEIQFMQSINSDLEGFANANNKNLSIYSSNKDFLLGPKPVVLAKERTPDNVEITITQSTLPKEYITDYKSYVSFDKNMTALSLKRSNMILDEINKNLIICDVYKLQKIMTDMETETKQDKKDGQGRMDKNTLNRILLRLMNEGYTKIFKLFMLSSDKFKTQWIVAHPTIDVTHPLWKASQEHIVVRFSLGIEKRQVHVSTLGKIPSKRPKQQSPFDSEEACTSLKVLKEISKAPSNAEYKINRMFGKILGYQPKFVRLQLMHELIYYLVYDYESPDTLSHDDVEPIFEHYNSEEIRQIPPIYRKTIDWKMFIPPLPIHKNFPEGWTLLCDVLLSMPLSLWVKIFQTSLECPKLFAYLEHPVRQHYLIKDVPQEFRYVLLYKRKYLFTAVELIYRMCFIGLTQLGPQSPLVKDQIFLYLNRNASLLDTSTSGPSYHKVTPQNYERKSFHFTSRAEVERYWCELWTISMNTPLGHRRIMDGKLVTIENPTFKTVLMDTLKCQTPSRALANDYGHIPGDLQGAAGLDSSMWPHVKKNWIWSSKSSRSVSHPNPNMHDNQNIRNANIACIKPVSIKYKELMSQSRKIYLKDNHPRVKYFASEPNVRKPKKPKIVHRKMKPAKKSNKLKKDEMDAKDKLILKKVGKVFRAKFNAEEDKILYICRAANLFLSKNMKTIRASRFLIRDILHILYPKSQDKTSGACARRLIKLERIDLFMKRLKERSHELINLKELSTHFSPIIFNLNKSDVYSPYSSMEKCVALIHVIWYIYNNYDVVEKILQGRTNNIDYFSPANIDTLTPLLVNFETKKSVFSAPLNEEDIVREVVKTVLMSALHCSKLGHNISYQFYQICKKYSDQTIRSAVAASKGYQAITINKKSKMTGNIMRVIPFQLSITYSHMQKSTFSCLTMHTIFQHFQEITKGTPRFADVDKTQSIFRYSRLLARNELTTVWPGVAVTLNVPDSAHILCPYIKNKSALIAKLAEIYQGFLKDKLQDMDISLQKIKRVNNKVGSNLLQPVKCSTRLLNIKVRVNRLLSSFPSFFNKQIVQNLSLFLGSNDEDEIEKFLEIFLDTLIDIAFNLLSTDPEGIKLVDRCLTRYTTIQFTEFRTKMLETRMFRVGFIIKEFLKTHQAIDYVHCFENDKPPVERNVKCEEKIRKWLEKSQVKCNPSQSTNESNETCKNPVPKEFMGFFRYKLGRNNMSSVRIITSLEDVPEVEEIAKGMMEPFGTNMKRSIPHISDIVYLLSQDRIPNVEDEKVLEEIKELFIVQYPTLEKFEMTDLDQFKTSFEYLFTEKGKPDVEKLVQRHCRVKEGCNIEMVERIKEKGGTAVDHLLAGEIIGYVFNQKALGATGIQIKKIFQSKQKSLNLDVLIQILCDSFIFLEVGTAEKIFVHSEFSDPWCVETFHLSPQDTHLLHSSENFELQLLQERIESRMNKPVKVIMMTWLHLDGTVNLPLVNKWLTIVLSYCLESPGCSLVNIFEKFYLVKPVELYVLLEILQELKCLEIVTVTSTPEDIWCDMPTSQMRPSTILDGFEEMVINVKPLAATNLGYYLDKEIVEFA